MCTAVTSKSPFTAKTNSSKCKSQNCQRSGLFWAFPRCSCQGAGTALQAFTFSWALCRPVVQEYLDPILPRRKQAQIGQLTCPGPQSRQGAVLGQAPSPLCRLKPLFPSMFLLPHPRIFFVPLPHSIPCLSLPAWAQVSPQPPHCMHLPLEIVIDGLGLDDMILTDATSQK